MTAAERAALLVRFGKASPGDLTWSQVYIAEIHVGGTHCEQNLGDDLRATLATALDEHAKEAVAAALDWSRGPVSGERLVEIAACLAEDKELLKNMTEDRWAKTMIVHFDDLFQHIAWLQQLLTDATTDGDVTRRWEIEDAAERRGYERAIRRAMDEIEIMDGPTDWESSDLKQAHKRLARLLDAKEAA